MTVAYTGMVLQICFVNGEPIPGVDTAGALTVRDVRERVAEALGATPLQVELLVDDGMQLGDDSTLLGDLQDVQLKAFVTSIADVADVAEFDHDTIDDDPNPSARLEGPNAGEALGRIAEEEIDLCNKIGSGYDSAPVDLAAAPAIRPDRELLLHAAPTLPGDKGTIAAADLLAARADVNEPDGNGETPLHRVVYHGRQDMVDMILEARADVDVADKKGKTPLRKAYDNRDIARSLITARANPNVADRNGDTALHRTVEDGREDIAALLLDARADVHAVNGDVLTALHVAASAGAADVLKLLIGARAKVDARSCGGDTALHFAVQTECAQACQVLLSAGADSSAANDESETPLDMGMRMNDGSVPEWLLPRIN